MAGVAVEVPRREVTVALNGDGGDECFLGYRRYKAMRYVAWLDEMPSWIQAELARLLGIQNPAITPAVAIGRVYHRLPSPRPHLVKTLPPGKRG